MAYTNNGAKIGWYWQASGSGNWSLKDHEIYVDNADPSIQQTDQVLYHTQVSLQPGNWSASVEVRAEANTTLVPTANIVLGGSGANRTVTVTPAPNMNGTATITLTASEGAQTTSDTFLLTVNAVNDAPTASNITDRSIAVNTNTGAIAITIGDIETAATSLTLTKASSNPTLVPQASFSAALVRAAPLLSPPPRTNSAVPPSPSP